MLDKKLIIAFVTNNYTPYSGGVVSSIQAFTQELRALGHRVYIITLDFAGAPIESGVIRISCPIKFMYKNNPMAIPWAMRQELEAILVRMCPDIVHTHHPFFICAAARDVCKKLHIPLVFTFHTHYEKYTHYIPLPGILVRTAINYQVKRYCHDMDVVCAPSTSVISWLQKHNVRCFVRKLPSPLLPVFEQQLSRFLYKKHNAVSRLLFVGRFTPEKNIKALLDLMTDERLIHFNLTLAGFGYLQDELMAYAYNKLNLAPARVQFIMCPSKSLLCQLYKESDFFVFCGQTETQGLVFIEAMAAGTPIIALCGPGQEDVVVNGVNGFLVETLQQFSAVLCLLRADQQLAKKLQFGAWTTANQYTAKTITGRLLSCYHEYLSV